LPYGAQPAHECSRQRRGKSRAGGLACRLFHLAAMITRCCTATIGRRLRLPGAFDRGNGGPGQIPGRHRGAERRLPGSLGEPALQSLEFLCLSAHPLEHSANGRPNSNRSFFTGYYDEAAAPMLAYYQAMENYQVSNNVSMYYMGYAYNITPCSSHYACWRPCRPTWPKPGPWRPSGGWPRGWPTPPLVLIGWWNMPRKASRRGRILVTPLRIRLWTPRRLRRPSIWRMVTHPAACGAIPPRRRVRARSGWVLASRNWYAEGWIQRTYNITAGTYRLEVRARSGDSPGYWPMMNVYLGPASGSASVESTTNSTYSFKSPSRRGLGTW